jgi:hypothetical protein
LKRHIFVKISPNPSLPKRGNSSLLQREGRRDLVFNVHTIMDSLARASTKPSAPAGTVTFFNVILRAFYSKFKIKDALSKSIFYLLIPLRKGFLY